MTSPSSNIRLRTARSAVAVVTDGAGALNGVPVRKGDRLVISDEADVSYAGDGALVLCLPGAAGF